MAAVCGRLGLVRREEVGGEEVGGCEGTDMGCPLRLATLKVALPMKDLGAVGSCGEPSTTLAAAAAIEGGAEKAEEEEEDVDGVVAEEAVVEVVVEDERAWRASACASISAASEVTPAEGCTVCLRTLNLVMKGDAADCPRPRPPRPLVGPTPIDVGGGSPPGPPSIFFTLLLLFAKIGDKAGHDPTAIRRLAGDLVHWLTGSCVYPWGSVVGVLAVSSNKIK